MVPTTAPVINTVTGAASVLDPAVKKTGTPPNTAATPTQKAVPPTQKPVTGSAAGSGTSKAGASH